MTSFWPVRITSVTCSFFVLMQTMSDAGYEMAWRWDHFGLPVQGNIHLNP